MGNFYVNHTVCPADAPAIVETLSGRDAFVSNALNNCVVVFDKDSDELVPFANEKLAGTLSANGRTVLAVMNHDDDVLMYWLFRNGELVDNYDSMPDFGEVSEKPAVPVGGDANKLCEFFSCSSATKIEAILRSHPTVSAEGRYESGKYVFAVERHKALTDALGLPDYAVGLGYRYLEQGSLPPNLELSDFIRVQK